MKVICDDQLFDAFPAAAIGDLSKALTKSGCALAAEFKRDDKNREVAAV
jgi:hypothetical protein